MGNNKGENSVKIYLNSIVIAASVYIYAATYWLGTGNMWQVGRYASLSLSKPWVYRQLVPILARLLGNLVPLDIALVAIVTLSGVSFYLALRSLILYINDTVSELKILLFFLAGILLLQNERLPYDMMTGFLWTLGLLFIVQHKHIAFMILFPFVCLNRIDTAPLLIVAYWLRFPNNWGEVLGCLAAFVVTYTGLHIYFTDNPGSPAWIEPWLNVLRFWNNPWRALLHFFATVVIFLRILIRADHQPLYFQRLFIVLVPIFVILYLVAGQAFEIRVFMEMMPILVVLTIL